MPSNPSRPNQLSRRRGYVRASLDLKFLTPLALAAVKDRLKVALNGVAKYKYLGKKDESRALRVRIDPKKLVPAFPHFHLLEVDVRDRNFMLKIGRL